MRALLLTLLLGCAEECPPERTLGEAAEEVAFAQCSRWITCGSTDEQWQDCVDSLVMDFCAKVDCTTPYPEYRWDNVVRCAEWFVGQSCSTYVQPCRV